MKTWRFHVYSYKAIQLGYFNYEYNATGRPPRIKQLANRDLGISRRRDLGTTLTAAEKSEAND
jgi:hypothetical protein